VRRKINLLLIALTAVCSVVAVGIVWGHATSATPAPSVQKVLFCGTCHSMDREVLAWQDSAHTNVACLQCHVDMDPSQMRSEFEDLTATMASKSPTAFAHTIDMKVPNERCVDCHTPQMDQILGDLEPAKLKGIAGANVTAPGPMPVKAMHNTHLKGKPDMKCVDCHSSSAHGPNPATVERRDASHKLCQECHDQKKVAIPVPGTVSCAACHNKPSSVAPANHKSEAQWRKDHGKASNEKTCGECHLDDSAGAHGRLSQPAAFPTKAKDACASCHAGVAMPHQAGYVAVHGQVAMSTAKGTCETCHSAEKNPITPTPAHAKGGFCTDCHAQPMPHPVNYAAAHGPDALKAPASCETCHSAKNVANPTAQHAAVNFCSTCHDKYQHPAGWITAHATKVTASCATCHTMLGEQGVHNACATCHSIRQGAHPQYWFVTHSKAIEAKGKASCMQCHDQIKPSCTQCHRNP